MGQIQFYPGLAIIAPWLKRKPTGVPEADRCNNGPVTKFLFVITVHTHAVITVPIIIQQHAVEGTPQGPLNFKSQCPQLLQPWAGLVGYAGITVTGPGITVPRNKARTAVRAAEQANRMRLPLHGFLQYFE